MTLWMKFYTDPNELILSYEQDETGQEISIQGMTVYRYTNADRTNYLWPLDNTLYRLSFHEAVQNEEDYVRTVIAGRESKQPTEQTGSRSLQATDDPDALIAFLGFDPGLPRSVAGVCTSRSFTGLIRERYTAMSCYYRKGSQPIDDPLVTIIIRYYHDANDAYISLEQSEEGETISVGGIDVYRYRNCDIYGYMWTQENQVCTFSTTEPPEIAEAFLEDFLRQRNAAQAQGSMNVTSATSIHGAEEGVRQFDSIHDLEVFLGFQTGLPNTLRDEYHVSDIFCAFASAQVSIQLFYKNGNGETIILSREMFTDVSQAYLSLEQNAAGDDILVSGIPVYQYTNEDKNCYTWHSDNTVFSVELDRSIPLPESIIEEVLKSSGLKQ